MKVHIAQQHANRSTLRGSLLARMNRSIFQDACLEPFLDQADDASVADAMLHELNEPRESVTYYPSPQPFGFGDDPA